MEEFKPKLQYRNTLISSIGDREVIRITTFNDKIVTLKFGEFDTDIDVDNLLQIHHHNIVGEIVTMPVLVNKIGILKAQAESDCREYAYKHEVLEAKVRKSLREKALANGVRATILDKHVKDETILDEGVRLSKKTLNRKQKEAAFVESLYWAVKSKDDKVNKLGKNLTPLDLQREIVEGYINFMVIEITNS